MRRINNINIILVTVVLFLAPGFSFQPRDEPLTIHYPGYFGNRTFIPEDNPTTKAGVELGRALFYEKQLSAKNLVSCATCHKQELAFTDGKQFSAGADGTLQPRNTMSLVNLLWVENLFWDGRAAGLENQAVVPLTSEHEMGQSLEISAKKLNEQKRYRLLFEIAFGPGAANPEKIVKALAQFQRTLVSADSKYDQYLQGKYQPDQSELNGIRLFYNGSNSQQKARGANCAHCHGGPKTYSELFHNNGLDTVFPDAGRADFTKQKEDLGRFRVVSLRNIALTAPYMHDGRFNTLEEVIDHYSDHIKTSATLSPFLASGFRMQTTTDKGHIPLALSAGEKRDLLAFLNMLTDSVFITNKQFSDPLSSKK